MKRLLGHGNLGFKLKCVVSKLVFLLVGLVLYKVYTKQFQLQLMKS